MRLRLVVLAGVVLLAASFVGANSPAGYAQDDLAAAGNVVGASSILTFSDGVVGAIYRPAGDLLYVYSREGYLRTIDPNAGAVLAERRLSLIPEGVAMAENAGAFVVWNGDTLAFESTASHANQALVAQAPAAIHGAHWDNDALIVYTWHADGSLLGWNPADGGVVVRVEHNSSIDFVQWRDDGRAALLASWSGQAALVDFDARLLTPLPQWSGALAGAVWRGNDWVAWGWDGRLFDDNQPPTALQSTGYTLWEVRAAANVLAARTTANSALILSGDGQEMLHILSHDDRVTAIDVHDDLLLTTGADGWARVWSLATGELLWQMIHGQSVRAGWLAPRGDSLATITADGALHVFPIPSDVECYVTAPNNVNQRAEPATTGAFVETLPQFTSKRVQGVGTDSAGFRWYQLENTAWVREDVVLALSACRGIS